jgi:hypothetical protein
MEVDAFVADSVAVAESKLYVQGVGWDTIVGAAFPLKHPRIGIGVILRVPWTSPNRMHTFSVKIVDADGEAIPLAEAPPGVQLPGGKIYNLQGQFNVGRPHHLAPGESQVLPIGLNLDGLTFSEPNTYSVVIEVDGIEMRRLPIRVCPTPPVPRPPAMSSWTWPASTHPRHGQLDLPGAEGVFD